MAAPQVFRVLTEFKFEAGQAIVSAGGLQGAVDKISESAKDVQFQLGRIGLGFAAQLGVAGGGAIGLLANVIRQFDTIEKQQIKLGGIFFANKSFLGGITDANTALQAADKFLLQVSRNAQKFGLNERALAQFSSLAVGITSKEGITPEKNIEFARNILKASPQLGVNAFEAQGQITRGLLGGASLGDPAFRAIVQETAVFKDFSKKVGGIAKVTKEFNKLPTVERFRMLNAAFGQFTQNGDLLAKQAQTLSSLFLTIKQALFGFNGVFRRLGEVIVPLVKDALNRVLKFIQGPFREIVKNFTDVFKNLIPNLDTLIIRLQQLSDVAGNFKAAGFGVFLLGIFQFIGVFKILKTLGVGGLFVGIGRFVKGLGGLAGILGKLRGVVVFLFSAVKAFLAPLLVLLTVFDILSRALAIARIQDAVRIPIAIERISLAFSRLTKVFAILFEPIDKLLNAIAGNLAFIFRTSFLFEALATALETLESIVVSVIGGMIGAISALVGAAKNLFSGEFSKAFSADEFANIFKFSSGEFFKDVLGKDKFGADGDSVPKSLVNINKVEIRNDFKEKIEPDRVAFTVKDQLLKAAQNPTQAVGRSFSVSGVAK